MTPITVHRTALPEPIEERLKEIAGQLELSPREPGDDPPTCGDEGGGNLFATQKRTPP